MIRPYGKKPKRRSRIFRGLLYTATAVAAVGFVALMVYTLLLLLHPSATRDVDHLASRLKSAFSYLFLNADPKFYRLVLEKNGNDETILPGDKITISHRDEFVVKEVVVDAFAGRGITVDIEGLGTDDDFRRHLRGAPLVDRTVEALLVQVKTKKLPAFNLVVRYRGKIIAQAPIKVELTPQDWLRHARGTASIEEQILALGKALEMNNSDTSVRRTLAALYLKRNMIAEAIDQYIQIIRLAPGDIPARRELLQIHLDRNDHNQVIRIARELIKIKPEEDGARFQMALAHVSLGNTKQAIEVYEQILKRQPDNPQLNFKLGELYESIGSLKKAIEFYRKAQQKQPKDENILLALADTATKLGDLDEAIEWYQLLLKIRPDNADYHALLGAAYSGRGMLREAIESYQRSLKIRPDNQTVRFNLAVAFEQNKMDREAVAAYRLILKARPNDPDALERMADCLFRLRDFQAAVTAYERLLKIDRKSPRLGQIHLNMAVAYGELKRFAQSAASYEEALKRGMKDPLIHFNLAVTYGLLKQTAKEIEAYERFAALQPSRDVLSILATHYMDTKQWERAISAYLRLADLETGKPALAAIFSSLGYASGMTGNTDNEIKYYLISLRHDPHDYEVHYSLGLAYEKRKMLAEARKVYLRALELNHASVRTRERLRRLGVRMIEEKIK